MKSITIMLFLILMLNTFSYSDIENLKYEKLRYVHNKSSCIEEIEVNKYRIDCAKWKFSTIDDVQRYIKKLGLDNFFTFEVYDENNFTLFYNSDYEIPRSQSFIKNLITFHNDTVEQSVNAQLIGTPYDILRYLVNYSIKHEDIFLLNALQNGVVSRGSGEYSQAYAKETIIPLLLNFPNIDYYLSDWDVSRYAAILFFDWFEVNQRDIDEYKSMHQKVINQSARLAEALDMNLRGMILVKNNKLSFDEFNKIVSREKNIQKNIEMFTKLLQKYKLTDELKKYH